MSLLFETYPASAPITGYAQVALEQGVDIAPDGLTYGIPAPISDLQIGERVIVPLGRGNKPTTGYVTAIDKQSDLEKVKPIKCRDPRGISLTSDLIELDSDGNLVEGDEPPEPTAFFIHWRIHVNCPQARAILHTHMPYATTLSAIAGARLEPIVQPALKFYNQIAYDDQYNGLAMGVEEGDRLSMALKDRRVAILANHGVITTGPTVAHAFNDLYYLERAAQAQILAYSTGQPLQRIPQDVCAATFEQMQEDRDDQATRHLAEIKRILDKEQPDYKE